MFISLPRLEWCFKVNIFILSTPCLRPLLILTKTTHTVLSDGFLCFMLQDNGLGIDLVRQQHKIFGLYRRFHPHIEGKGLGLHMVKTQVESIGAASFSFAVKASKAFDASLSLFRAVVSSFLA